MLLIPGPDFHYAAQALLGPDVWMGAVGEQAARCIDVLRYFNPRSSIDRGTLGASPVDWIAAWADHRPALHYWTALCGFGSPTVLRELHSLTGVRPDDVINNRRLSGHPELPPWMGEAYHLGAQAELQRRYPGRYDATWPEARSWPGPFRNHFDQRSPA